MTNVSLHISNTDSPHAGGPLKLFPFSLQTLENSLPVW